MVVLVRAVITELSYSALVGASPMLTAMRPHLHLSLFPGNKVELQRGAATCPSPTRGRDHFRVAARLCSLHSVLEWSRGLWYSNSLLSACLKEAVRIDRHMHCLSTHIHIGQGEPRPSRLSFHMTFCSEYVLDKHDFERMETQYIL